MNPAAYAADADTTDIEYIKGQKSPLRDFFDAPMTAAAMPRTVIFYGINMVSQSPIAGMMMVPSA